MSKFLFRLFVMSIITCNTIKPQGALDKSRLPLAKLVTDFTSFREFQLTFLPKAPEIQLETVGGKYVMDPFKLIIGIPSIGIYQDPYLFDSRLVFIQLAPHLLKNAAPSVILNALSRKTIIFAQILMHSFAHEATRYRNIIFHPFAYVFMKKPFFNVTVQGGIFDVSGVNKIDIPLDTYENIEVNPHNGTSPMLSPNNARFLLENNRLVATFWSAAVSPNQQYATVTYHVLFSNKNNFDIKIKKIVDKSKNLRELLLNIQALAANPFISSIDKNAINRAITTILKLIDVPVIAIDSTILVKNLDILTMKLNNLYGALVE